MKPLDDRAHEGRVNPKGIPCLSGCSFPERAWRHRQRDHRRQNERAGGERPAVDHDRDQHHRRLEERPLR